MMGGEERKLHHFPVSVFFFLVDRYYTVRGPGDGADFEMGLDCAVQGKLRLLPPSSAIHTA